MRQVKAGRRQVRALPSRATSPYQRRALEYWRLDQQYRHRSRFLAAASMVSHVLAWVERYAFFVVGRPGAELLAHIGSALNGLNLRLADRIPRSDGCPSCLDEHWVRLEQSAVQRILQERRSSHPHGYATSMRGIDRLLAFASWGVPVGTPQARVVSDVIRDIAKADRRRLRFASQADRERIGIGLIARIRTREEDVGLGLRALGKLGD
jgi:hypothetical protein